jgi:type II secretory pathway component PulF
MGIGGLGSTEFWYSIKNFLIKILAPVLLSDFRGTRAAFYEELAKSMENKEQFRTFLLEELKIAKNPKTSNQSRATALSMMYDQLRSGEDFRLSTILGVAMPTSDRLMLGSLDHSPNKAETLRILAASLREQALAKNLVIKAVIPPAILLPGISAFCWVMATQSLPIMVKMSPPDVWSPFNQSVRSFCEFVADHGGTVLLVFFVILFVFSWSISRWSGNIRGVCEQFPVSTGMLLFPVCPFLVPLSIYRDFQVSILFSSMAVLLQSGMTLTETIRSLIPRSSPWMRWHLERVLYSLHYRPAEYMEAFSKGLLGPMLLAKLSSAIRHTPHFDKLIIKLGTSEGEQIRKQIASVTKTLNTLLLLSMGGLMMYLYVGQFSISQSLTDALSSAAYRR